MNKWAVRTSEEARRQSQAASVKAKHQQNEILKERAQILALDARKTENLRALRLAKEAAEKLATAQEAEAKKPVKARKKRISAKSTESPPVAAGRAGTSQEA